ncbi:hypothetical protein ACPFUM_002610 [Vibrio cholerae]
MSRCAALFSKESIVPFFLALFAFTAFNPFYLWGFYFSSLIKFFFDIAFILFFLFLFLFYGVNRKGFLILPFVLIYGVARYFPVYDYFTLISFLGWFVKIIFFLFAPFCLIQRSMVYFSGILGFFGFFSIFAFLQVGFFGKAFFTFELINPYPAKLMLEQHYLGFVGGSYLPYLVKCTDYFCFSRMNGAFDEPGLWGTVCALYLIGARFDLKPVSNKLIFFSGLITFSLAFYFLIFLAILFSSRRNLIAVYLVSLLLIYFIMPGYFNDFILSRLNFSHFIFERSSGELLHLYLNSGVREIIFGHGYLSSLGFALGESSWLIFLYEGGFFLVVMTFVVYFASLFFLKGRFVFSLFLACLFMSFFQRPEIVWVGYFYLFLLSVYSSRCGECSVIRETA